MSLKVGSNIHIGQHLTNVIRLYFTSLNKDLLYSFIPRIKLKCQNKFIYKKFFYDITINMYNVNSLIATLSFKAHKLEIHRTQCQISHPILNILRS